MECFCLNKEEIVGRFDPHFYRPTFAKLIDRIEKIENLNLGEVVEFSSETWNQMDTFDEEFPYIEIGEIDVLTGDIQNISYIPKKDAPDRAKKIVRSKDIIVSLTRPNRGAISIIDSGKDGFIASTGFSILRSLKINIDRMFLFYILRCDICLKQMMQRSSGGNYPAITQSELKKIQVPILNQKSQDYVIEIMDKAYASKIKFEVEAEKILDSIDDYILDRLKLDFLRDKRKVFTIESNTIQNRLDPLYYSTDTYYFLKNSSFPISTINKSIKKKLKSGFAAGKKEQDLEGNGIVQIRPTNIQKKKLVFDKKIFIKTDSSKLKDKNYLKKGEILFNNTNSQEMVGKATVFDIDGTYVCSNHITRISVDESKMNPIFLASVLNIYQKHNVFFRICTNWNNQSGINNDLLKEIKLPLPPIDAQNEIADEVQKRMEQAEKLQSEATMQLEKAKNEIEKMILGE